MRLVTLEKALTPTQSRLLYNNLLDLCIIELAIVLTDALTKYHPPEHGATLTHGHISIKNIAAQHKHNKPQATLIGYATTKKASDMSNKKGRNQHRQTNYFTTEGQDATEYLTQNLSEPQKFELKITGWLIENELEDKQKCEPRHYDTYKKQDTLSKDITILAIKICEDDDNEGFYINRPLETSEFQSISYRTLRGYNIFTTQYFQKDEMKKIKQLLKKINNPDQESLRELPQLPSDLKNELRNMSAHTEEPRIFAAAATTLLENGITGPKKKNEKHKTYYNLAGQLQDNCGQIQLNTTPH